jgi:hypothetical protein
MSIVNHEGKWRLVLPFLFLHIGITSKTESKNKESQSFKLSVTVYLIAFFSSIQKLSEISILTSWTS